MHQYQIGDLVEATVDDGSSDAPVRARLVFVPDYAEDAVPWRRLQPVAVPTGEWFGTDELTDVVPLTVAPAVSREQVVDALAPNHDRPAAEDMADEVLRLLGQPRAEVYEA